MHPRLSLCRFTALPRSPLSQVWQVGQAKTDLYARSTHGRLQGGCLPQDHLRRVLGAVPMLQDLPQHFQGCTAQGPRDQSTEISQTPRNATPSQTKITASCVRIRWRLARSVVDLIGSTGRRYELCVARSRDPRGGRTTMFPATIGRTREQRELQDPKLFTSAAS